MRQIENLQHKAIKIISFKTRDDLSDPLPK